jgi:hypothetical protein
VGSQDLPGAGFSSHCAERVVPGCSGRVLDGPPTHGEIGRDVHAPDHCPRTEGDGMFGGLRGIRAGFHAQRVVHVAGPDLGTRTPREMDEAMQETHRVLAAGVRHQKMRVRSEQSHAPSNALKLSLDRFRRGGRGHEIPALTR